MMRKGWLILGVFSASLSLAACSDDPTKDSQPDSSQPDSGYGNADTDDATSGPELCSVTQDDAGEPLSCVKGRIVDEQGQPLARVRVQACTAITCIVGTTNLEGRYSVTGLPVEPHKIELIAAGRATMAFFQDLKAAEVGYAPQDVVMPALTEDFVPLLTAQGGAVTLAEGRLGLAVKPGALRYPIGTPEEEQLVAAVEISPSEIAPYDVQPWLGKEGVLAFVVNPFPLASDEGVELTVWPQEGASKPEFGSRFQVFASDTTTSRMSSFGVLVADEDGVLRFDGTSELTKLTTLVLVPE